MGYRGSARECSYCWIIEILRECWQCGEEACEECLRRYHEHRAGD